MPLKGERLRATFSVLVSVVSAVQTVALDPHLSNASHLGNNQRSTRHEQRKGRTSVTHRLATSPQVYARVGGALYLAVILLGIFAQGFVRAAVVVPDDAVTTAHNITASHSLWTMGAAANLIVVLCAVPLALIEYVLLRPVSRTLAQLALLLNVVSLGVESVSKVFFIAVLPALQSTDHLVGLGEGQVENFASLLLTWHDVSFNIALIFFGLTCLVNGYLIFQSRYFPRVLGVLMQIAGACYLIACFSALFVPALVKILYPTILIPCLVGELSLCLWLLFKGVNLPRWLTQTGSRNTEDSQISPSA